MTPSHATSEDARYERKATRDRLRRMVRYYEQKNLCAAAVAAGIELDWCLSRQKRYDAKPGGLGKM